MILSRMEWTVISVFKDYAISVFTVVLKMETATGSGIFSYDLDIPTACIVFRA